MLCMSDTVYEAVLGLNYTVTSLLIHKIAFPTYIMFFKWAPKDYPVFFKSLACCTWSSFHSLQTQKKATLTAYVFGLIRRMLRNKKFQLLIQITHCQVHIPCTDTCVKAMQIYVQFNIQNIKTCANACFFYFYYWCTGFIAKTTNVDLNELLYKPPRVKALQSACERHKVAFQTRPQNRLI